MKILGICREVKNKWERRVPLNPEAVKKLVDMGIRVQVEPSKIRIYNDLDYLNAGAELKDDLSECDLVVGVKEIPPDKIIPGKSHLFFSHTIKGQDYNMPLLKKFLDTKTTLIDYERIVDKEGRRLIFFGDFAGKAGIIEGLRGFGIRLKKQYSLDNPFLRIKSAFQYSSFSEALDHLREIGDFIKKKGMKAEIVPLNIFLLGYGNVSKGVQEVLSVLPVNKIAPRNISAQKPDPYSINLTVFKERDLVVRKDGGPFDLQDYFQNGHQYESKLEGLLSECSIYVNAIYWREGYPVFLSNRNLSSLYNKKDSRLQMICDITCDIKGSVEATVKATKPDNPCYIYNPQTSRIVDGLSGDGFPICAVDNLPCEFPRESSDSFSKALGPLVRNILEADLSQGLSESKLSDELKGAVITHQGNLEPGYEYLKKFLK
jgi:alpha-aminoadipic semialdehyde synthase